MKPPGLHRNEETFIRTLAVATGPFLYLVQTMRAMKQQAEKTVINLEHLQKVPLSLQLPYCFLSLGLTRS